MTPEDVLTPLIRQFRLSDELVKLLYYLLLREIENGFYAVDGKSKYEMRQPQYKYVEGLQTVLRLLPSPGTALTLPITDFLTEEDITYLHSLSSPTDYVRQRRKELLESIERHKEIVRLGKQAEHFTELAEYKSRLIQRQEALKELKPNIAPQLPRFWADLLSFNVSFDLINRNRHCHILGAPGTGKTSLIKKLAYHDMQTDGAVIVMAPKGNLIDTLARLPSDRTIWVKDWSQIGLNLLDLDPSLFVWVLESLLESEPTPRQKAFLLYCTGEVKNLTELKAFLKRKPPEEYKDVPSSISWRLDLLLKSAPIIDSIFSRETNLDILDVMDSGKILLLDTQSFGEAGSSLVGRFLVALISLSIKKRRNKRLVYVYLDEFPQYVTDHIAYMLDMAREANVCLHLAHQTLAQLSPRLKASIHNSALKFVGKCNYDDSMEMGREMSVDPKTLKEQPDFQFTLYGVRKPFPIKIKWDDVDRLATSHTNHFTSPRVITKELSTDDPGTGTSME